MEKIWLYMSLVILLSSNFGNCIGSYRTRTGQDIKDQISNTGLLSEKSDDLLFVATLDGALHAVTKSTGNKRWTLQEDPVYQNPNYSYRPPVPRFFPNPHDGSLYRYVVGRGREPLKKLPFTIPELVANSPCRSNDGIFYIGKKVDSWVGVDIITGKKQLVLGAESVEKVCPKPSRHTVYLGRTMYNIVFYELHSGNKWNVTFYHYADNPASSQLDTYDLMHYAATGEGSLLTVDKKSKAPLWNLELHSPIVTLYLLDPDNMLVPIPLTTVTPQTLEQFSNHKEISHIDSSETLNSLLLTELSPAIYVGETPYGVYAVPTLVDPNTAKISKKQSEMLLNGPPGQIGVMTQGSNNPSVGSTAQEMPEVSDVILLGYYDLPEDMKTELSKVSTGELGALSDAGLPLGITYEKNRTDSTVEVATEWEEFTDGLAKIINFNGTFIISREVFVWSLKTSKMFGSWLLTNYIQIMVGIISICLSVIVVILYKQAQEYARLSHEVSSRKTSSKGVSSGGSGSEITAVAEELEDGSIRVGKITFNPYQLLGKGCDGTFVFRGTFDGRDVAVKRVLPSCFSIADREVNLLRASDQHPNVIRYYCMEQCREFRYIALELCAATLDDFVKGGFVAKIPDFAILRQATAGLHHLHSLDIVHRDIKPHNVLLSLPDSRGIVRAMISDFGLCKQLEEGRNSFSKKSGVTGTEGWIAPEMLRPNARPTAKVDIFSLGCVYYFVLSKGEHPFGSLLDRQSNILADHSNLDNFHEESNSYLYRSLIAKMISSEDTNRPTTAAILSHPIFWSQNTILQFFQDVSDRVEKESSSSLVVRNLEMGAADVVRIDWRRHLHPSIGEDLRKFREYNGHSVKDLLRALRNKRNHYRELPEEAKRIFGSIPDEFVPYWTSHFPILLLHSWCAMQCCKEEPIFQKYYCKGNNFPLDHVHQMVSLSPNNRPLTMLESTREYQKASPRLKKLGTNVEQYNILDSVLGPPVRKGSKAHSKQEDEGSIPPRWILKKPVNMFEPQFSTSPKEGNLNLQEEKVNEEVEEILPSEDGRLIKKEEVSQQGADKVNSEVVSESQGRTLVKVDETSELPGENREIEEETAEIDRKLEKVDEISDPNEDRLKSEQTSQIHGKKHRNRKMQR